MHKITTLCVLLFLLGAVVFAADIGPLPVSDYAGTEVSTNFTFAVGEGKTLM